MHLEYIYDNTFPGDTLRKLVVDQRCYSIRAGEDPKVDVHTPHQMLLDIVDRLKLHHESIPGVARGCKEKYFNVSERRARIFAERMLVLGELTQR
jgi:hypothetical protein